MSIIGVIALSLFGVLFARLWYLQVASGSQYAAAAEQNSVRTIELPAPRGSILDATGHKLAWDEPSNVLTVDRKLKNPQLTTVVRKLSVLLGIPVPVIDRRLADVRLSQYAPAPVADDVPINALAEFSEHKEDYPGVKAETLATRRYALGDLGNSLAFHELGYIGEINGDELKAAPKAAGYFPGDSIGKAGVEKTFESVLRGKPGEEKLEVDNTGRVLRVLSVRKPVPGDSVKLTLQSNIQRVAEDSLQQGMDQIRGVQDRSDKTGYTTFKADAGAVVVLDASTGSVVAMASNPTFNGNQFVNGVTNSVWKFLNNPAGNYPLLNRAVSGQYAPGSTFKLVTATAGLQSGDITPDKVIHDTGQFQRPKDPTVFHNDNNESYGDVNLARALTVSSDVYFYGIGSDFYDASVAHQPSGSLLQSTARQFGFGKATGVTLPDESSGRVPDAAWKHSFAEAEIARAGGPAKCQFCDPEWHPGDDIHLAVGQGDMLSTPLQLANAYAAFANGGTLFRPQIAAEVLDPSGRPLRVITSVVDGHVPEPARDVMLQGFSGVTTDPKGTATGSFGGFPAGLVSGKTGTAQVQGKQPTSVFVGFTPSGLVPGQNPRYVVLSLVEEGSYGASTSAPIVARVMQALNHMPLTNVVIHPPSAGN
jgi:penicillin-binding protein 2